MYSHKMNIDKFEEHTKVFEPIYLGHFENTPCNCYNEGNKRFFKWHMDYHMMKIPGK
ncbi:hypothetical protein GCM10011384_27080 [Psychrobacillus lasiicapitis]|nr:hypothetical protein GCM10011384_27080 [Psychrobacillus lasiicapitis]